MSLRLERVEVVPVATLPDFAEAAEYTKHNELGPVLMPIHETGVFDLMWDGFELDGQSIEAGGQPIYESLEYDVDRASSGLYVATAADSLGCDADPIFTAITPRGDQPPHLDSHIVTPDDREPSLFHLYHMFGSAVARFARIVADDPEELIVFSPAAHLDHWQRSLREEWRTSYRQALEDLVATFDEVTRGTEVMLNSGYVVAFPGKGQNHNGVLMNPMIHEISSVGQLRVIGGQEEVFLP